jgi:hypothetical protein
VHGVNRGQLRDAKDILVIMLASRSKRHKKNLTGIMQVT